VAVAVGGTGGRGDVSVGGAACVSDGCCRRRGHGHRRRLGSHRHRLCKGGRTDLLFVIMSDPLLAGAPATPDPLLVPAFNAATDEG
jgi:hypothetical protein